MEIWRQHDVTGSKEYLTLRPLHTCFLLNMSWKFSANLNIFHRYITENVSGCFLSEHSVVVVPDFTDLHAMSPNNGADEFIGYFQVFCDLSGWPMTVSWYPATSLMMGTITASPSSAHYCCTVYKEITGLQKTREFFLISPTWLFLGLFSG